MREKFVLSKTAPRVVVRSLPWATLEPLLMLSDRVSIHDGPSYVCPRVYLGWLGSSWATGSGIAAFVCASIADGMAQQ
jgi:hypothetical protein